MFKYILLTFALILLSFSFSANLEGFVGQATDIQADTAVANSNLRLAQAWSDSVFEQLTEDERIGQLFMVRAKSDNDAAQDNEVKRLIKNFHIGGVCFFAGTPEQQAALTNQYQSISKVPLLVSQDAEWGLAMRLKEAIMAFPKQLMLGAIQDNALIFEMGKEVARQCRRIGVQVNFAPVVDINSNPKNPVIGERSFGEDRYNVASKCYAYMLGLQDGNVMACAKHFPGHGDTDVDSHQDLPVINHSRSLIDSMDLFPFKVLTQHGVQSVMVAHLSLPALDATPNMPTSLSRNVVTNLLQTQMQFNGLIFTDAMEMKGVSKFYKNGDAEVKALQAGNDVLVLPASVDAAFRNIKNSLQQGTLDSVEVNRSIRKILLTKYYLGLNNYQPVELNNIRQQINTTEAALLKRRLTEKALTLVRNIDQLVPAQWKASDATSFASVAIGSPTKTAFQDYLSGCAPFEHFQISKWVPTDASEQLLRQLKEKNTVFVSLHGLNSKPEQNFGLTDKAAAFIRSLQAQNKVVLTIFGNPYCLRGLDDIKNILEAYNDDDITQELAAKGLFGQFAFSGKLPISASPISKLLVGEMTTNFTTLTYGTPESVGMSPEKLDRIGDVVQEAIRANATPGAVVLVAKDGKIVYHKAFGKQTYDANCKAVDKDDVYDLASVTKVAASTISAMKLYDEGKLDLRQTIGNYLPDARGSNKENIVLEDVMAHHAGLVPWIPFYQQTIDKKSQPLAQCYQNQPSEKFSLQVCDHLYMNNSLTDTIWKEIYNSELRRARSYKYSDLGFYLTGKIVGQISGKPLNEFAAENFYTPMGLASMGYHPLEKIALERIAPTEMDTYFRQQLIRGTVHDMGAAMTGGVSGHAGLFADAVDLAKLMQMLLNGGSYDQTTYLTPATIQRFTTRYEGCTRRGIGFDMKELDGRAQQNVAASCSAETFGHQGFTGTCVWADPRSKLVFVFLSNRTFPNMSRNKLQEMNTRIKAQEAAYQAILR